MTPLRSREPGTAVKDGFVLTPAHSRGQYAGADATGRWGQVVREGTRMQRILLGTVATVALLGSGLAWTAGTSVATPGAIGQRAERTLSAHGADNGRHLAAAAGRVAQGTDKWRDPNTLTRRQAADLEARQRQILARSGITPSPRANGSVSIPIDFHGITDRSGKGFVSLERIHAQIRILNRAYGGRTAPRAVDTPFRFHLSSVSRTKNSRWYNASAFTKRGLARLRQMRRELHVGDARHLNMYTVGPKFGLLGFATFPAGFAKLDGTVLLNGSLPGGNANFGRGSVYNRGDTATHEIGHWLNLYHTFQGGCSALNDYVTDTPRQQDGGNIFEEDPTLNTCKPFTRTNRDPVRNFMNYVDDPFMNQFSFGQRDRMNSAWYIRQALSD